MGWTGLARGLVVLVLAAGCGSRNLPGNVGSAGATGVGGHETSGTGGGAAGRGGASGASASGSGGGGASGFGGSAPSGTGGGASGSSGGPGGATGRGGGAGGGTSGTAGGGTSGAGGSGGKPGADRRLPLPCNAPLPTGYCLQSDTGDYIGGGRNSSASGAPSVTLTSTGSTGLFFDLKDSAGGSEWTAAFVPGAGAILAPGLFDPAQRYPFQVGTAAGLSIYGNGRGCNTLTGKFAIEELARDPLAGITRASVTFEQHCEGGTTALRGVINYQATGSPDRAPTADRVVNLSGKVFRVAYDPTTNVAYGLDATNRRLSKIDLATGAATYANVVQVPNDACVDAKRGRLFVVNKGSTLITEYATADLKAVRDISWTGMDWGPTDTHFKITCAPDKLYVVDGAWAPALFTVEGLDGATPTATDHTAAVAGVGGLALNAATTDLYYWYQYGWSAGSLSTSVRRLQTSDLTMIDQSSANVPSFTRDPLDAPILLDESRGLVFVKNKVFDVLNLTKVVYSLPSSFDTFDGAAENAYALDVQRGRLATKNYVYDLARYDIVTPTIVPTADQLFFDASGVLWFLSVSNGALEAQVVSP
jgi:hypothetical protein